MVFKSDNLLNRRCACLFCPCEQGLVGLLCPGAGAVSWRSVNVKLVNGPVNAHVPLGGSRAPVLLRSVTVGNEHGKVGRAMVNHHG